MNIATSFTITKHPPKGGHYVVFCPENAHAPSPYDRVQFFCFPKPPGGFDVDAMFDGNQMWTLASSHIVDVLLDDRDNLPIFTVSEIRGAYCRLLQVGGTREIKGISQLWMSTQMLELAFDHGTLELLS